MMGNLPEGYHDNKLRADVERVRDRCRSLQTGFTVGSPPNREYYRLAEDLTTALAAEPAEAPESECNAETTYLANIVKRANEIFIKHKLTGSLGCSVTMFCLNKLDELLEAPPGIDRAKLVEVRDRMMHKWELCQHVAIKGFADALTVLLDAAPQEQEPTVPTQLTNEHRVLWWVYAVFNEAANTPCTKESLRIAIRGDDDEQVIAWLKEKQVQVTAPPEQEPVVPVAVIKKVLHEGYSGISDLRIALNAALAQYRAGRPATGEESVVPVSDEDARLANWIRCSVKPTPRPIWVDEDGDYYIKHPAFVDVFVSDPSAGRTATGEEPLTGCPTCGGTKKVNAYGGSVTSTDDPINIPCPDCTGPDPPPPSVEDRALWAAQEAQHQWQPTPQRLAETLSGKDDIKVAAWLADRDAGGEK